MRRDNVAAIVEPAARRFAGDSSPSIRTHRRAERLSQLVPTAMVTDYFGIAGAENADVVDWATLMFCISPSISQATAIESKALDARLLSFCQ